MCGASPRNADGEDLVFPQAMLSLNFSTRSAGTLERADNASGWHCPLLFPEGLAPSVIFPGTAKSGNTHEGYECVCSVCEAMHGEARERAGCCEGPELAGGCAASSDTPPGCQQVMVVPVHRTGAWSHLQASPLPTQHLMSAELFYLVILQGVG